MVRVPSSTVWSSREKVLNLFTSLSSHLIVISYGRDPFIQQQMLSLFFFTSPALRLLAASSLHHSLLCFISQSLSLKPIQDGCPCTGDTRWALESLIKDGCCASALMNVQLNPVYTAEGYNSSNKERSFTAVSATIQVTFLLTGSANLSYRTSLYTTHILYQPVHAVITHICSVTKVCLLPRCHIYLHWLSCWQCVK